MQSSQPSSQTNWWTSCASKDDLQRFVAEAVAEAESEVARAQAEVDLAQVGLPLAEPSFTCGEQTFTNETGMGCLVS